MSAPVSVTEAFGLTAEVPKLSATTAQAFVTPSVDLPYLRGHLPNLPTVPGMALVDLVPRIGGPRGSASPPARELILARFFSPLKPGEQLILGLEFSSANSRLRASGTIGDRDLGEIVWSYDGANNVWYR